MSGKRISLEEYEAKLVDEVPELAAALTAEQRFQSVCTKVREDLRDLRVALGLTQGDVAERLGMTQSGVSRLEGGVGDIGLMTVCRYADVLGGRVYVSVKEEADVESHEDEAVPSAA